MQNLEPQKLLEASALFRGLQPEEVASVTARLQPAHFKRGARIMERGVWHGQLHIIASGQVSVLLQEGAEDADETTGAKGKHAPQAPLRAPTAVAQLGPGECFGEMSLITGEPPTATIRAEENTTLWSLPQADFLALMGSCPTLLQNINIILSRRLARTNQQILADSTAEWVWLALADEGGTSQVERSLPVHIADAIAARSFKRVLLLEFCGQDEALGPHFARHTGQVRPDLLVCTRDASKLQAHRAPTVTADGASRVPARDAPTMDVTPRGEHYAAFASLAATSEEVASVDASIFGSLADLAAMYDYLLLVTTPTTPLTLVQGIAERSTRAMILISANGEEPGKADEAYFQAFLPLLSYSIFVMNVPDRPTIGKQDLYSARLGYRVTHLLPADIPLLERCWIEQVTLRQQAARDGREPDLTKAVDFVARYIARQTVGIAFGGGGARGFAHLGVLEGLLHHGIPLDYIAACSSGIITPGMYLIGKSFAESEEIFLDIQRHIVQWRFPRTSIFSNKRMKHMLQELCGELRFEDLTTPFAMVAIDLATRAGVVLDRGPLWQAGLASVALPGIFPPVMVGEHILMDAGMHDPVPIRLVRRMGADILLASELGGQEPPSLESATPWLEEAGDLHRKGQRSPHMIDLLLRTYDLTMATIGMHSIREADVVIRPKLHRVSLRQFSEGRKFVAAGREAVEQALPMLRKHLPWVL